jgi:hypothetical protein
MLNTEQHSSLQHNTAQHSSTPGREGFYVALVRAQTNASNGG